MKIQLLKMHFDSNTFIKNKTNQMNKNRLSKTLAMNLLDKMKIAGGEKASNNALYSLDRDLGETPDEAILAQDVTAVNP